MVLEVRNLEDFARRFAVGYIPRSVGIKPQKNTNLICLT